VGIGSGVWVGGSGVDVLSPAGTVSVGWAVGATVSVYTTAVGGTGVGCGAGALFPNTEIRVTAIVPATPMSAAVMVGSSLFAGSLDMAAPIFLQWFM
jgi:hypothetical protein